MHDYSIEFAFVGWTKLFHFFINLEDFLVEKKERI